ncbi:MAG: glucosaminidase domain-containing protein [Hydrogenoanaerobacterium sp.]
MLVLLTTITGVVFYEKPSIQTGTDTNVDIRNWYLGSGKREIAGTNYSIYNKVKRTGTTAEHTGISQCEIENTSPTASETLSKMEVGSANNGVKLLGAGYIADITVRQGYRYYTANELEKGLLHDLKPLAPLFIKAQDTYGIDAVFLAAVSAEESGWGRYKFRDNNIFGFENCDYDSLEACINSVASWLHTEYLTPSGRYYEGLGVADINIHYNGRKSWESNVALIMHQIVERIESEE